MRPELARLGIVVGLAAEARLARPLGEAAIGGGLPAGAEAAAERLVARGADALLSFGLCGGLHPALPPGTLLVPREVRDGAARFATDAALAERLGGWSADILLAERTVVAAASEKARLFAATRAAAVDLESGAVARVAARHGLPFAVLRAVCDPAERDLPPTVLVALDQAGTIAMWRVLARVAANPGQVPALLRLASDAATARRALLARVRRVASRWPFGGEFRSPDVVVEPWHTMGGPLDSSAEQGRVT
jgi:adenosylhomocysteine nucleosidase